MINPNAIVAVVDRIDADPDEGVIVDPHTTTGGEPLDPTTSALLTNVRFRGVEQPALLDLRAPDAREQRTLLHALQLMEAPAYVDVEPRSRLIARVLAPTVGRVLSLGRRTSGDWHVFVDTAPAPRVLTLREPGAPAMLVQLETALRDRTPMVLTTHPEDEVIFDVRSLEADVRRGARIGFLDDEDDVIAGVSIVPRRDAQRVFDSLTAGNCEVPFADDCLPLRYTNDYCFAVAHHVCKTLAAEGITAGKAWLYGDLQFATPNRVNCRQPWQYHVAAFVRPRDTFDRRELTVIDPVVFLDQGPMRLQQWRAVVGAPTVKPVITTTDVFNQSEPGEGTIEFEGETELCLAVARSALHDMRRLRQGPPPYRHCRV